MKENKLIREFKNEKGQYTLYWWTYHEMQEQIKAALLAQASNNLQQALEVSRLADLGITVDSDLDISGSFLSVNGFTMYEPVDEATLRLLEMLYNNYQELKNE